MTEVIAEEIKQPRRGRPHKEEIKQRKDEDRSPLNHAKESTDSSEYETIGGVRFRKKRSALDHSSKMELDIRKELLHPDLNYRWVNDFNGRVEKLREMDYEIVDQSSFKGKEITSRRRVGTNKDGSSLYAQLMATPKIRYDDRKAKADADRNSKERGFISGKSDIAGEALGENFYNKGSKIQR